MHAYGEQRNVVLMRTKYFDLTWKTQNRNHEKSESKNHCLGRNRFQAINNETISVDRRAHVFWENPIMEDKINELIESITESDDARFNQQT